GELELPDVGEHLPGGLDEPVHAAGVDGRVEAALVAGRADDDAPIGAWDDVTAGRSDDALGERRRAGAGAQVEELTADGMDRGRDLCRQTRDAPAPAARGEDDGSGGPEVGVRLDVGAR